MNRDTVIDRAGAVEAAWRSLRNRSGHRPTLRELADAIGVSIPTARKYRASLVEAIHARLGVHDEAGLR